MKRTIGFLAVLSVIAGCTPTDFTRPLFPAVPTAKPSEVADAKKSEPKVDATKMKPPVMASQITDQNAREIAAALSAEIEQDAAVTTPSAKSE